MDIKRQITSLMKDKKKIKMIFFDMDGVLFDTSGYKEESKRVALSCWNVLFQELGIYHEHERLKEMYIKGIFPTYMDWTDEACRVLKKKGLKKDDFEKVIKGRLLMKGAIETLKELKIRGYKTAVITGSFMSLAQRAKEILGLDYVVAHCKLNFDDLGKIRDWELVPCDFDDKANYFKKIADRERLKYSECAFVGDDINDVKACEETGLSIAFNSSNEKVRKVVDIVIEKKDLREILKYFPKIN